MNDTKFHKLISATLIIIMEVITIGNLNDEGI